MAAARVPDFGHAVECLARAGGARLAASCRRADQVHQLLIVGHTEHGHLGDARMLVDRRLHLGAVHVLTTAQDHVLGPVDDEHEPVVVDVGDVAGVEPSVRDALGRGLGAVEVALDDDRAAHAQLARTAGGHLVARLVDEFPVERRHDPPARQRLRDVRAPGVGGDDAVRLGQAVARARHTAGERLVDLVDEVGLQRSAAATHPRTAWRCRASTNRDASAVRGSSSAHRRSW